MGQPNTSLDAAKCCLGVGEAKIPLDLVGNQSWEEPHGRARCLECPRETRGLRLSILRGGREGVAPISPRTHGGGKDHADTRARKFHRTRSDGPGEGGDGAASEQRGRQAASRTSRCFSPTSHAALSPTGISGKRMLPRSCARGADL